MSCLIYFRLTKYSSNKLINEIKYDIFPLHSSDFLPNLIQDVCFLRNLCVRAKSLQLCPTLRLPLDCSLRGSCVHGILQARILERVAVPSSKGLSQSRDRALITYVYLHWKVGSLPLAPPGKPLRKLGNF